MMIIMIIMTMLYNDNLLQKPGYFYVIKWKLYVNYKDNDYFWSDNYYNNNYNNDNNDNNNRIITEEGSLRYAESCLQIQQVKLVGMMSLQLMIINWLFSIEVNPTNGYRFNITI